MTPERRQRRRTRRDRTWRGWRSWRGGGVVKGSAEGVVEGVEAEAVRRVHVHPDLVDEEPDDLELPLGGGHVQRRPRVVVARFKGQVAWGARREELPERGDVPPCDAVHHVGDPVASQRRDFAVGPRDAAAAAGRGRGAASLEQPRLDIPRLPRLGFRLGFRLGPLKKKRHGPRCCGRGGGRHRGRLRVHVRGRGPQHTIRRAGSSNGGSRRLVFV
mmetsp:Transcript_12199/g.28605  ORF Transcript_12199/g.28605 Transcript_12199/m.28605 type:complete len:216 (+) Transcript_12199:774-1421(+)